MPATNRLKLDPTLGTALMMAASAGLLASPASATTFTEGADFVGVAALPAGTDVVNGVLTPPTDFSDEFTIPGLLAGSSVDIASSWTNVGGFDSRVVSSADVFLAAISGPGVDLDTVTVPADGTLKFVIAVEFGEGTMAYSISLSAIPEPGTTAAGAALAMAALVELRRRRAGR